ncbi:MAG: hypothetical protein ACKOXF_02340 [Chitinophagaceae bacterium]
MSEKNSLSGTLINSLLAAFNGRWSWIFILFISLITNSIFALNPLNSNGSEITAGMLRFFCNLILALAFSYAVFQKSKRISQFKITEKLWFIIIPLALILRLIMAKLGGNYDLESFELTADIILNGDSVYAHTSRYNYGPVWAYWLGALKFLSSVGGGYNKTLFHSYIVVTLFLAELTLLKAIRKQGYSDIACLILLFNPVSIILIGHHSQFDIIAIALGYIAYQKLISQKMLSGLIILGLSFSIKHLLVFLPLLMLFNQDIKLKNRLLILVVPALIFGLSFLPFIADLTAIKKNVLSYQLNHGQTLFYKLFEIVIPHAFSEFETLQLIPLMNGYKPLWIASFLAIGYVINTYKTGYTFEIYLAYLVASSLAISEQYFLIPILSVVLFRKQFISWIYLLLATYYIMFVSAHNTSKYFRLDSFGIYLPADWYSIGFAQVQLCLLILVISILIKKRAKESIVSLP